MVDLALIPAAGEGMRAYPATTHVPKVLLEIAGKPLIQRNVEILRDQLGVREVVVIVGYLADQVRDFLGDGSQFGVSVRYVHCENPKIGLAGGVLLAEKEMDRPFVTVLGDELYLGSNHGELKVPDSDYFAMCAVRRTDNPRLIQKNYSVVIRDGLVADLEEKPIKVTTDLLGCGTYVFTPALFDEIRNTAPNPKSGRVELTDVIRDAARRGDPVVPFYLEGEYINVNSVEDMNYANYVARSLEFKSYKTSVIIPAYNEEETLPYVVADFVKHPDVDEVLVVNNSSKDRTAEVAAEKGARVETVQLKGYGDTIRWGLDNAIGDMLVIVEADHSFRAKDVGKMLEFLKDADMVMGTRTTRQMIEQGANMQGLLRWGNVVVGKIIELLWWSQEPRFTDVGCTYRALWKDVWTKIRGNLRGIGPEFSPELMIEVLRARKRVIEIPVSYHARIGGESKHSDGFFKVARTALRMLKIIFAKRFNR